MARWRSVRHSRARRLRNARARSNNRRLASGVRLRHDGVSSPRRGVKLVWQIDEREPDPLALDPGNLASKHDIGVARHDEAKLLWHESGLFDANSAAFRRDVQNGA